MLNLEATQKLPTPPSTAPALPEVNPDKCWFCVENDAKKPEHHVKVPMYRGKQVGQEKNEKGIMVDKYEWNTIKFPVPRCGDCEGTHHSLPSLRTGPPLLAFLAFVAAVCWELRDTTPDAFVAGLWNGTHNRDLVPLLEILAYGVCGMFLSVAVSKYLTSRITVKVPGELYARHYPVLLKLISDGWIVGAGPKTDATLALNQKSRV